MKSKKSLECFLNLITAAKAAFNKLKRITIFVIDINL